jgi:anthranilate phosphoribosyltransferase
MPIRELLAHLASGQAWSQAQGEEFFEELLAGALDPSQVGAALGMIQLRGPAEEELVAGATVMRRHVTPVPVDDAMRPHLIDTCGTGGAFKTFNVSTLAAIVAGAAGKGKLFVAKHGNRSRTGRGSAEVLQGLGVNVNASPLVQARCLRDAGVCLSFAVHHHPAMKHAATPRQMLGFPTIFNCLGPLTNPAGARRQVMGIYDPALAPKVARTLARLRCIHAWVLHSDDGLDELSVAAPTRVWEVREGLVQERRIDPAALGLAHAHAAPASLAVADLGESVRLARDLLDGAREGANAARRDMLVLNAGAVLLVGGVVSELEDGVALARDAIDAGAARATLVALAGLSHAP